MIPVIPWWWLATLLRLGRSERDYDWSLRGMTRTGMRKRAIVLGWAFWIMVIFGFLLLLKCLEA